MSGPTPYLSLQHLPLQTVFFPTGLVFLSETLLIFVYALYSGAMGRSYRAHLLKSMFLGSEETLIFHLLSVAAASTEPGSQEQAGNRALEVMSIRQQAQEKRMSLGFLSESNVI